MANAYLVDGSGSVIEVPADQAGALAMAGYTPASPEQIAAHQEARRIQEEYGGIGSQAATFAEKALSALTFGGSTWLETHALDPLLPGAGFDPESIRSRAEASPAASGVGTAVGVALPLIATLGTSAPVSGAQAATAGARAAATLRAGAELTAPALVARVGKAVTSAVERALPEASTLAGRAVREAAALGAGSAIEGAAYGLGQVVDEAALGDPNLTAQSALATIGWSAALGGGFGGLLGGTGVLAKGAIEKAGEAARAGMAKAKAAYPEIMARLEGQPELAGAIREGTAKYESAIKDPREVIRLQKEFGDSVEEVAVKMADAQKRMYTEARPREVADLLGAEDPRNLRPLSAVNDAVKAMRRGAKVIRDSEYELARARALEELADGLERRVTSGDPVRAFEELKRARREIDDLIPYEGKPPAEMDYGAQKAIEVARGARRAVKEALIDPESWGRNAVRQAALDELHSDYASAIRALTKGRKSPLGTSILRTVNIGGRDVIELNPRALRTLLSQMGDDRSGRIMEALGTYFQAADDYARGMEATFAHSPTSAFDREALTGLVERARKVTERAGEQAGATRFIRDLDPNAQFAGSGVKALLPTAAPEGIGSGVAALAASPFMGPLAVPAALYGAVRTATSIVRGAKNIPQMIATLSHMDRMVQKVTRAIDSGAATIVRGGERAASVGRAEAAAGIAREFSAEPARAAQEFGKRVAEVQRYAQDPDALHRAIVAQNQGIEDHAPNTATALAATSARAAMFLASKVPNPPQRGILAPKWTPSRSQVAKFARYYDAVDNPLSILKQAAAGTLTREGVEAVKTVHPELFAQMQTKILEKLSTRGAKPSPRARIALSMMLGADVDGRIGMIQRNQSVWRGPSGKAEAKAAGGMPGAASLTLSDRSKTSNQRAATRG